MTDSDLPPEVARELTARRARGNEQRERAAVADQRLAEDLRMRLVGHLLAVNEDIQDSLRRADPAIVGRLVAISGQLDSAIREVRSLTFPRVAPPAGEATRPPLRPAATAGWDETTGWVATQAWDAWDATSPSTERTRTRRFSPVRAWRAVRSWWAGTDDLGPVDAYPTATDAIPVRARSATEADAKPHRGLGHTLWY